MGVFLKIAWRNVTRNRYRSLITIASITIGFASLIFIRAFVDGAHYQMVDNYTGLVSGHIQIHRDGFHKKMGLQRSIRSPQSIIDAIGDISAIEAYAGRVKEYALISSAEHSSGVLLMGIDPDRERSITDLHRRVPEGTFPANDAQIVIGKDLADLLNVSIGDKIVVIAQAYDGSLASAAYRVSGLLDTGAEELDKGLALITLGASQELFVLGNMVSEIAIKTGSHENVGAVTDSLRDRLDTDTFEILPWQEISPILVQWIEFDVTFINVLLLIVLMVIATGILNTLLMGILERVREFGIMLALGTKRSQILLMIALESILLGAVGITCGLVIGTTLSYYFGVHGIDLSAFSTAMNDYYTGSVIFTRISLGYVIVYGVTMLLTSIIVSIYPAWRAASLKPVDAIRHI